MGGVAVFWRLRNSLARMMVGRYGMDQLNLFIIGAYFVLWVVSWFFSRTGLPRVIISALSLLLAAAEIFRLMSRNIPRRQAENQWFLRWWRPTVAFLRRQWDRLRYVKKYRYRRCPYCKVYLRLPIRRGSRTVTCSRCGGRFHAFFL